MPDPVMYCGHDVDYLCAAGDAGKVGALTRLAEDTKASPNGTLSDKTLALTITNGVASFASVPHTAVGSE